MNQTVGGTDGGFVDADEARHDEVAVESWWWWARSRVSGGDEAAIGVFVGLELRGTRFDYWAGLVREGQPYLYVEELDGTGLRRDLEIKPAEMWADHACDVPFVQWSLGNEAHGVLLDDPTEAWRRAHGVVVPVTFDIEWYAAAPPLALDLVTGATGYRQLGEVDVQIELSEGIVAFAGPGERVHAWGAPYVPRSFAMPTDHRGLRAPYRRTDGTYVDQVLTDAGWWMSA